MKHDITYECNNNTFTDSSILYPLSSITVDSILEPMTFLATDSFPGNFITYGFLSEWDVILIRKQFVTPLTHIPLLNQWACLARPVANVALD